MTRPPEPLLPKPVGALWLQRDPLGFFQRCQQRYGDVFTLSFGTGLRRNAWVCDPALVEQIIDAGADELEAGSANSILRPVVGGGSLLLLTGGEHAERRALLADEFDPSHLAADRDLIRAIAASHLSSWRLGTAVELWSWVRGLAMEIMLRVVFGLERGPRADALGGALAELVDLSGSPPLFFPQLRINLGPWPRFLRCRATVEKLILRQIVECRNDPALDTRGDIVALAVRARFPDGRKLSDREICDEAVTLMIAGKETAAGGLAWALDLLLRNVQELARVRDDLRRGSAERLRAAVFEALRLRTPLFAIGRAAVRGYRLGRFTIPPGMGVAVPLLIVNRSPRLFREPTRFLPQRYLDDPPSWPQWIPFGGGIRKCIGVGFAPVLIEVLLREILERIELELVDLSAEGVQLRAGALVVPKREVAIRVAA